MADAAIIHAPIFQDAAVLLVAAGVIAPILFRLRLSPIIGFLCVGVLVGPNGLGRLVGAFPWMEAVVIADQASVQALSEIAIVLLMFAIGIELSLERLIGMRRLVFGLGGAQMALCGLAIGAIAYAFGNPLNVAIVAGIALGLSSTAIVLQTLTEQGKFARPVGRAAFGVLLFQDLMVAPALIVVGFLGGAIGTFASIGAALASAAIALGVILVVGRQLAGPFLRFVGSARSREVLVAASLLIILALSMTTQAFGLSAALGAFLAGLLLAETEFRHEIEHDLEPFKGLMLGLFFMGVGMSVDPVAILADPLWAPLSAVGLILLKAVLILALGLVFKLSRGAAVELGLLLGQGGEFAFVIFAAALQGNILSPEVAEFMLLVTGLSMVLTPPIAAFAGWIGARLDRSQAAPTAPDPMLVQDSEGHVIIAGFGRVGQMIGHILDTQQTPYLAIDLDAERVAARRKAGGSVFYGDAGRADILKRMGLDNARAVLVTNNDPEAAERIVAAARAGNPKVAIIARARDRAHAQRLAALGAQEVVHETIEASLQMADLTLRALGVPDDGARAIVESERLIERLAWAEETRLANGQAGTAS